LLPIATLIAAAMPIAGLVLAKWYDKESGPMIVGYIALAMVLQSPLVWLPLITATFIKHGKQVWWLALTAPHMMSLLLVDYYMLAVFFVTNPRR